MKNLTEAQLNTEWTKFWNNMQKVGLAPLYDEAKTEALLKRSSAALSEDTGLAYPGALLVHINLMTDIALELREIANQVFNIDEGSLLKVCLLHQFSKAMMYVPNDNQWEREKRGLNYKFAELSGKLKFGERSIFYAVAKGVKFNAEEWEAMKCLDVENDTKVGKSFESILTTIVRQANELAYAMEKITR